MNPGLTGLIEQFLRAKQVLSSAYCAVSAIRRVQLCLLEQWMLTNSRRCQRLNPDPRLAASEEGPVAKGT